MKAWEALIASFASEQENATARQEEKIDWRKEALASSSQSILRVVILGITPLSLKS